MKNDGKSFKVYTKKKDTINILKKQILLCSHFSIKKKLFSLFLKLIFQVSDLTFIILEHSLLMENLNYR